MITGFLQSKDGNFRQGRTSSIKYIVIHYTGNNGDTAKGNISYFSRTLLKTSAHYFVDEKEIWQSVKDSDTAYHCGTSGKYKHAYCRNTNSIGVELCSRKNSNGIYYFKDETVKNAIALVKSLMKKYNVSINNIVRHYDVTGKICPAPFVSDVNQWNDFKSKLIENKIVEVETPVVTDKTMYEPSTWAKADAQWAMERKLILGDAEGKVEWKEPISKQEIAALFHRFAIMLGKE